MKRRLLFNKENNNNEMTCLVSYSSTNLYGGSVHEKCSMPRPFISINRIVGEVAYMRPLKLQASLRARDLVRKHELVDVGHRFGKVGVLATMPGNFYLRKLKLTPDADQLKFNGRLVQITEL